MSYDSNFINMLQNPSPYNSKTGSKVKSPRYRHLNNSFKKVKTDDSSSNENSPRSHYKKQDLTVAAHFFINATQT